MAASLPRNSLPTTTAGTRLILIRHAHVDTGPDGGRLCGWLDLPLSPAGRRQLEPLHAGPGPARPDALYSSSLLRARATADALGHAWNLPCIFVPALREIGCGELEGVSIAELRVNHSDLWSRNLAQSDDDFAWPSGESYRGFRERIRAALTRIAARHPRGRVSIVTHTGAITQVMGLLHGDRPAAWEHHRAAPFSATEIEWRGNRPTELLFFNRTDWWRASPPPAS